MQKETFEVELNSYSQADLLISLILLCSQNPENRSLGKHCLLTSFISVLLFIFMQAGGFTI